MAIKIDAKKLKEYLEKVTLKGIISEFVLEFTEEGIVVNNKTPEGGNAVISLLKREVFTEYESMNKKFGIKNSDKVVNVLSTFSGTVNIDAQENLLTFYNKSKSASFVLAKPEFMTDTVLDKIPEAFEKFDEGFTLDSMYFTNALKNTSILGSDVMDIKLRGNELNIQVGENNFDKITEKVNIEYKDVKVRFQNTMKVVIPCLTSSVNFSVLEDNAPARFICKTDDFVIKFIVAPIDVSEETETSSESEEDVVVGEVE